MNRVHGSFILIFLFCLYSEELRADVKMPGIFGDHMVLQQDGKIPVWGTADPGEEVTVRMGSQQAKAKADIKGDWRIDLPPLPTNPLGQTLTVSGKNVLTFQDVLIGDVWICSGQSNMGADLGDLKGRGPGVDDAINSAVNPPIRLFFVKWSASIIPKQDLSGSWQVCSPTNVAGFSAVAYFFGRHLQQTLNRPIGLIESSWPGTYIQSWIGLSALKGLPGTSEGVAQVEKELAAFPKDPTAQAAVLANYSTQVKLWQTNVDGPYRAALQKWQVDSSAAKASGQPEPPRPVETSTQPISPDGSQDGEPMEDTAVFNGIINPLIPYGIKGVIWYQGESNAMNIDGGQNDDYSILLKTMITDWRSRWNQGDFPFLIVGLANFGPTYSFPTDSGWARVREAQAQVVETVGHAALAQAVDIGEGGNIHPADKLDVGERLAAAALYVAYGQDVPYSGPTFDTMTTEGGQVRIRFKNIGLGLKIGAPPHITETRPALSTTQIVGFSLAGVDHQWKAAQAKLDGNGVEVSSDQVPSPVAVRYGWAQNPTINLYNAEGFPAVPFRTDNWAYVAPPPLMAH